MSRSAPKRGDGALRKRRRPRMKTTKLALVLAFLTALRFPGIALAQTDPGVRSNTGINAGQPLASVSANPNDLAFFQTGLAQFNEHQTVTGDNPGLGPRFNLDSCGACHSQPASGGTSPSSGIFPNVGPNPQSQVIANGIVNGSTNAIPFFVLVNGPVREARFPFFFDQFGNANPNAPNGGVEDLFTVSGRSDAGSCSLPQPSFNAARAANNIIFRIPTPTFGTGLMANIDDSTLIANHRAQRGTLLGISGTFNHNGSDGTISRFGWKAQNKSLMIFSGEAYNVEMGISNELFQSERDETAACQAAHAPNNVADLESLDPLVATNAIEKFSDFMRFLAAPVPSSTMPGGSVSIAAGRTAFQSVGCAWCHRP